MSNVENAIKELQDAISEQRQVLEVAITKLGLEGEYIENLRRNLEATKGASGETKE